VGFGGITTGQVLHRLIEEYSRANKAAPSKQAERAHEKSANVSSGVIVKGYDDMVVRFARCCNRCRATTLWATSRRGRGVSVHRSDCSNVSGTDFEYGRMIEVKWSDRETSSYNVEIQVTALDRAGLIAEITAALYEMGLSITSVNARMSKSHTAIIVIGLTISATAQLGDIQKRMRGISGVTDVFRLHT
jgi:GTP pyrophosphokinase